MPIKMPTIERVNTPNPQSVGRVESRPLDTVRPMAQIEDATMKVGEQAVNYVNKLELDAADTEATSRAIQYEQAWKNRMYGDGKNNGIKFSQADPTELYNKFDAEMNEEYKRLTEDETLSGRTRDMVLAKLQSKANQLDLQKLTEQGGQTNEYERNVTDTAVSLEKESLIDAASMIHPDDPKSTVLFEEALGRIRDLRLRHGMKMEAVKTDENGRISYIGPMVDHQLKKDLSEGVALSIDNAIKSGNMHIAEVLKEKFSNLLNGSQKAKLADDFQKGEVKEQAYEAAAMIERYGPDKGLKGVEDPEVRDKALDIYNDREAKKEQIRERKSKQNYNYLANHILKKQQSDDPYVSMTELEADPIYINAIGRVTDAKQRKAIIESVIQPKESDDSSINRMQKLMFGEDPDHDIREISPEDFNDYLSGMSKSDRKKYTSKFEQFRSDTGSEQAQRHKAANKELTDQMLSIGLIKKNNFNQITGRDEMKLIEARNELTDWLDKNPGPMSPKDIKEYTRQFAISKKSGETFVPPTRSSFDGGGSGSKGPKEPTPILKKDKDGNYYGKTLMQWAEEFKLSNKRNPNVRNGELTTFILNKNKGN
jgi:hypothetical protein